MNNWTNGDFLNKLNKINELEKKNNIISKLENQLNNFNKINLDLLLKNKNLELKEQHNQLKDNKITYLQENMNMQLEDKDYISENKLLKNQIHDQEEIIKQLLERL